MKQAIVYVRRSTDKQEESLTQQRDRLEAYAKAHGWVIRKVYADDAISGSEMKRPGLEAMLRDVEQMQDVEVVLAWDRNRLARPKDPIDGMMLERRLLDAGKRVVYASTGQEADRSFTSALVGFVEHHQNGDYLRKLSRDTMRGLVERAKRGQWPGGPIPFGYDRLILDGSTPKRIVRDMEDGGQAVLDPESGRELERLPSGKRIAKQEHESCTLIPSDPKRVRAVQQLFANFAAGHSTRQLCDALNAAGFRTSRGGSFGISTLLPLLENPAYLGKCVYNRRTLSKWHRHTEGRSIERYDEGVEKRSESDWIVCDDAWPALIDQDTFDRVKARRQDAIQRQRHTCGRSANSGYLLTNLIHCGICGGRLSGVTCTSGKGYKTRYYTCCTHHNGNHDRCPKRYTVPADLVEQHLVNIISGDLMKLRDDEELHTMVREELERITGGRDDARQQLQRRLAELDQSNARLRDHLMSLPPETAESLGLYGQAREIHQQRARIEAELAMLPTAAPALPPAAVIRERAREALIRLAEVFDATNLSAKREMIASYVQRIKAEPEEKTLEISLYSPLFSSVIAGAGFEPATSGL